MPDELNAAVEKAAETIETPSPEVTPDATTATETKPEGTDAPEATETKAGETGPSEEEITQALGLMRALNDPNTGPAIARVIAERLGVVEKPAPPKTEERRAPTSKDILTQHLGEEYAFLGDKLAPALDQYIQQQLAPIQQQIVQAQVKTEFDRSYTELDQDTKGDFKKFEGEIVKLMDRIKPADGTPIKSYLFDLYTIAKATKAPTATNAVARDAAKAVVDKINKNAQERTPSPSAASELRLVKGPAQPTLAESIAAALRGERFGV